MDNEDKIKQVLGSIAQKWNLKKWRYEKRQLSKDILNFMANIVPVVLIDEESNVNVNLILKVAPQIPAPEIQALIKEMYIREVYFYKTLLPTFKNNSMVDLKELTPECYYMNSSENQLLALQDMEGHGFKKHINGLYLDQNHVVVTLQTIAKFHTLSMVLDAKNIELPGAHILRPFVDEDPKFYWEALKFAFQKYLYLFKGSQCESDINYLWDHLRNKTDFLYECEVKAKRLAYVHGDLWKENILFKYADTKPVQVCLLDFQITRLLPPAAELQYFIMNCTESLLRRNNFDLFLYTYYRSLQEGLRSNGLDPETSYSEEDIIHDMKLMFPYNLVLSIMSFSLWLKLETTDSLLNKHTSIKLQDKNLDVFKNIIERLLIDFKDFGIFVLPE